MGNDNQPTTVVPDETSEQQAARLAREARERESQVSKNNDQGIDRTAQQEDPTPSIGRVVHYISYGTPNGEHTPQHRAAIITSVKNNYDVSLCVLNPNGFYFNEVVTKGTREGQWHWPERV